MIETDTGADARNEQWTWTQLHGDPDSEEGEPSPPRQPNLWQIGAGTLVMLTGVILPALALAVGCAFSFEGIWRLTLLHPVETILEALLVLLVPTANYEAWYALCYKDFRRPIRLGIMNGIAIAVPAITFAISAASFALSYPLIDSQTKGTHELSISLMGVVSLPALAVAVYLTHCLRKAKQTRDARIRTVVYSLMGIALTFVCLMGAEFRSAYIRIAQTYALSDDGSQREMGLAKLREANPEKELKMVCADPHAAGLAGMFLPLDTSAQKRLYFAATGKPYRDRQSTNMSLMSNDYLRNHVVGPQVDGLSLHRSGLTGNIHPQTLSSTLNWTFVFKNRGYVNQEARAEMALPEGAVISNLTIWINGQPCHGAFSATENAACSSSLIDVQHRDPALITDLGRGRYLLQASPVPGQGEMKVQVAITEPLKLDGGNIASFGVPRFIDSNFTLAGHHNITLRSCQKLTSGSSGIKAHDTADGDYLLAGELKEAEISNSPFAVKLDNAVQFKSVAARDPFSGRTIYEQLKTRNATAPQHLVVVVDSSQAMKDHVKEVISAIRKIPSQIETTIMLASDRESSEALSREDGIKRLQDNTFGGGQDNLFALVKAAERAGESHGGAVLWIHGPQPGYNNEMYLMAPYAATPRFFEIALDDCLTDVNEFFKNHKEVGPFTAIARTGPLGEDLASFLSKWEPGARETYMDLGSEAIVSAGNVGDHEACREVAILSAARTVQEMLSSGKTASAAQIGVQYHIVTPVSGAVVLERKQAAPVLQGATYSIIPPTQSQAPVLEGATAGTIGPQGTDVTVIQGINTAGTVRVNNLANLEALLNIFANMGELLGIGLGIFNVVMGVLGKTMIFPFNFSPKGRIVYGICIAVLGLMLPGCLNWMVASARDANLFD
jgi:hypothetical protein